MVRAWGGVPLVTTTTPPLKLTRASEEATYGLSSCRPAIAESHLPLRSAYTSADGESNQGSSEAFNWQGFILFRHDFQMQKNSYAGINSTSIPLNPIS